MKKILTLAVFALPVLLFGQADGTPTSLTPAQRNAIQQQQLQNGNDTLNRIYTNTACGLNYTKVSERLGQRFTPIGVPQPAALNLATLPACADIDTAFIWFELLGVPASAPVITLINPQGQSVSVQSQLVGSSIDVCWTMNGTHVYRAEVTNSITTNGVYTISGIPTSQLLSSVDAEGVTLLVVYRDPTATYTGTLMIDDGAATVAGGALTHTMTGISTCSSSSYANAFMLVGDLQFDDYMDFNGNLVPFTFNWWNDITDTTVSIASTQTTFTYGMNTAGDCYTFAVAGLYFQTSCQSCVAVNNPINYTTTVTPATCNNNGSISLTNITGGTGPYTYQWSTNPLQTTSTVTNLSAGNYYVQINGSTGCGGGVINVPYAGVTASIAAVPASCGLMNVNSTVTGGTPPYTYLWMPSAQTTSSLTNLSSSGTHWLTVTDANGCSFTTQPVNVTVGAQLSGALTFNYSFCANSATGSSIFSGGTPPYTYLWSTGATTSTVQNLTPGTYSLTITDANGCTLILTDSVVSNNGLQWLSSSMQDVNVACYSLNNFYAYANDPAATYLWLPSGYTFPSLNYSPSGIGSDTLILMAMNACDTISDTVIVTTNSNPPPAPAICGISVDIATNDYVIAWDNYYSQATNYFEVYKEVPLNSGTYTLLTTQSASVVSFFVDTASNASLSPERYRVIQVDNCGGISAPSTAHAGISLTLTPLTPQGSLLTWTAYQGAPVQLQSIYRGTSLTNMVFLASVPVTDTFYVDTTAGTWLYYVEVYPMTGPCSVMRLAAAQQPTVAGPIRSNVVPDQVTGVAEIPVNSIGIAPNPADGQFALTFNAVGVTQLRVFDIIGQEVHREQLNTAQGNVTLPINLNALTPGIYLLQLSNGAGVASTKLVIRR